MGRTGWDGIEYGPRIKADGIKAQTQRGKFGQSWWAGQWIAALERLVDPGRLARGRSYARSGQVLNLAVGPGGVTAQVQGSRPAPYRVAITFRKLSDAEWSTVADALAARALYAAALLAGDMPERIEEAFSLAGVTLFPAATGDLQTTCSCPDISNPCKHSAAVYYLLGERFDDNPFLIFALRGRTKDELTAALRARRTAEIAAPVEEVDPDLADEEEPDRAGDSQEAFWSLPAAIRAMALRFEPAVADALAVKRLGPPPFVRDPQAFADALERAYAAIAAHARRRAER